MLWPKNKHKEVSTSFQCSAPDWKLPNLHEFLFGTQERSLFFSRDHRAPNNVVYNFIHTTAEGRVTSVIKLIVCLAVVLFLIFTLLRDLQLQSWEPKVCLSS